jgi:hypothetical protein
VAGGDLELLLDERGEVGGIAGRDRRSIGGR